MRRLLAASALAVLACRPEAHRVLAVGDSITGGGRLTSIKPWPHILSQMLGLGVVDEAHSGFDVGDMLASYEAGERGRFSDCFFMGGVNDIRGGADAGATFETASKLLDEMAADGCFVHVMRPTPFGGSASWTPENGAEYDALWERLQAKCASDNGQCLDTWPYVGDGAAALNRSLDSGDGLHPNQAGQDVLAAAVYGWAFQ